MRVRRTLRWIGNFPVFSLWRRHALALHFVRLAVIPPRTRPIRDIKGKVSGSVRMSSTLACWVGQKFLDGSYLGVEPYGDDVKHEGAIDI